jgi:hypothetical protein
MALGVVIFVFNISEARGYEFMNSSADYKQYKNVEDVVIEDTAVANEGIKPEPEKKQVSAAVEEIKRKISKNRNEVSAFCDYWFRNTKQKYRDAAEPFVDIVAEESVVYGIDPLAVAMLISRESSWRSNVTGFKKNEKGLMQVHGVAARGFDTDTPRGQVQAGINHLKTCLEKCGDYNGAFRCYATRGNCNAVWNKAKERFGLYNFAVANFRNVE